MAPPKPPVEHKIDRTPEYERFIEDLRAFHAQRGTQFDPEPKMGNMNVDLYKTFNYIVENGGYDKVSEEKLMWRKMCENLGLMRHNAPADAYTLKQIFYRQLAAYEIKTIHKKEPPPPEILEFTTAKGGSLLTRTIDNFSARVKADKEESPGGDDGTPSRERRVDEAPTSSVRASRGLREAPAPRVIYQPDTNSSRQTRHASGQQPAAPGSQGANSPAHPPANTPHSHANTPVAQNNMSGHHQSRAGGGGFRDSFAWPNPSVAPDLINSTVSQFQPGQPQQLPLRIVDTPINNPDQFARKQRLLRQGQRQVPIGPSTGAIIRANLPIGQLDGPNIYERCLFSLRSGIRAEQAFALNHLVKISYERGDKYKFSQFSGLAEGLTEFALKVGNLFFETDWLICNDPEVDEFDANELDGINGTPDILERIARLRPRPVNDNFQSAEFTDELTLITEAVLTIRNMVMLGDNAWYMSEYMPLKDLLVILLNLPQLDVAVELKHSALDIAEQITPYLVLGAKDPLYQSLLAQLSSDDRGSILTSLRAIGRIAMTTAETNQLGEVPPAVLRAMMDWLLLNDDELMDACLDFLYQYTAKVDNLDRLLESTHVDHLVTQLVRLLSHGAKRGVRELPVANDGVSHTESQERKPEIEIPVVPSDLLDRLVEMDEPSRCYQWVKCIFEEDADHSLTQIAVWQAYTKTFADILRAKNKPMINAGEFIKNISTVYQAAGAQIVREGETQRFIIRGIRARPYPLSPEGQGYFRCKWTAAAGDAPCSTWHLSADQAWRHILVDHLGEQPLENGTFKEHDGQFACGWRPCTKYPTPVPLRLTQLMAHIKTHLTVEEAAHSGTANQLSTTAESHSPSRSRRSKSSSSRPLEPTKAIVLAYEETVSVRDERNPNAPPQPAGIPLSAVLILRNIARNVGKTRAEEALVQKREDAKQTAEAAPGYKEQLFRPVLSRLWEVFTENRLLAKDLSQLFQLLDV